MVETALIIPIFLSLLLGIGSSSVAYGHSSSINNASREAARYGATLSVEGDLAGWLTDVAAVAEAAATGDVDTTRPSHTVCIAYVYPDGVDTNDRTLSVNVDSLGPIQTTAPCFADGRPNSERRVQVVIQRDASIEAAFFSSDFTIDAEAAARFERG
ncbi:MAG: TadE/TadG family type IV pilus assembly protein [Acidimicrobiales bacterium]